MDIETRNYTIGSANSKSFIILNPTPDFPHFYYNSDGNLGSLLYRDVSVMSASTPIGLHNMSTYSNFHYVVESGWCIMIIVNMYGSCICYLKYTVK